MKDNNDVAYLKTKPYALHCDEGQNILLSKAQVTVKATSEQTGGAFNLFEIVCPPDYATFLHIHYAEDVAICVLQGALTFFWGSVKMAETSCSYCYLPRGIPHGFRVEGDSPARILYLAVPAGLDQLVTESEKFFLGTGWMRAVAQHKIEILGPLPE
jgi:quercetin dioxygenase-like cupin family protein